MRSIAVLRSLTVSLFVSAVAACGNPMGTTDGGTDVPRVDAPRIDALGDTPSQMDAQGDIGVDHVVMNDAQADVAPDVQTDTGPGCLATQHLCGTTCRDNTDPAYGCGSTACTPCSVPNATAACTGTTCSVGSCTAGFADCDGMATTGCEVNTGVNPMNCGSCGHGCTASEMCVAGACVPATSCPISGNVRCGGTCTDTQTDGSNCGVCGTVCPSGTTCTAGACHCAASGTTLCGSACVNTQTDGSNCGTCGTSCTAGSTCVAGVCSCGAGSTSCSGTCRTLATDNANCGSCGNACAAGQGCVAGMCTCAAGGQTNCSGTCRDLQTDNANCGACGTACPAGRVCTAGVCGCPAGGMVCGGVCAATQTDNNNCGSCGNVCGAGQTCTAGVCSCTAAGTMNCSGTCRTVATDNANCGSCGHACGAGQTCAAGVCTCPAGQTDCGGACRNLVSDTNNCGACGMVCAAGQTCTASVCVTATVCGSGQTNCSGVCRTTATDNNNCGGCGTVCPAGLTCTSGVCSCPAGQTTCGGACVTIATDANNCGGCGTVCTGGRVCAAGLCGCPAGQTFCGGVCISTVANSTYCAPAGTTCGVTCTGGTSCAGGACVCPAGQHLCGGTCIDTTTSNNYCATVASNSCGVTCTGGQNCVGGACTCAAGQHLCGGTCTDTTTNNTYCATVASMSCGTTCTSGRVCNAGTCGCPGSSPTFCPISMTCVNTTNDNNNCGTCGTVCPVLSPVCVAGACTSMPPPNDLRANAQVIDLTQPTSSFTTTFVGSTSNTTNAPAGCLSACGTFGDVFYQFTLHQPELVYADTFGSQAGSSGTNTDTILILQDSAGNAIASAGTTGGSTCDDDHTSGCTGGTVGNRDSQVIARLNGTVGGITYYLVLKECNGMGTSAQLHFHHLAAGGGVVRQITPGAATASISGNTSTGMNLLTPSCQASSVSPEDMVWFTTCPSAPAQTIHEHTCGSAFDTVLYERSSTRAAPAEVCNDDNGSNACSTPSSITVPIPAGTGIHATYVDGYSTNPGGAYTLTFQMPPCATGFTLCGAVCVDETSDDRNCGGCGVVCGSGTACNGSVCRPTNDDCLGSWPGSAGALPITLTAPGTTTTLTMGNTTLNATSSAGSPASGPDTWYSFVTGPTRELVYLNTFGTTTFDSYLQVYNACGGALIAGNDDSACGTTCTGGCTYRASSLAVILDPGTHYLQVDGFAAAGGTFSLAIQRIANISAPVGVPANTIAAGAYAFTTLTTGSPTRIQDCGSTSTASPENTYVWLTCPASTGGTFTSATCDALTNYDTTLEYRVSSSTASPPNACNDDVGAVCSQTNRSFITTTTPPGAAAHVLTVSGFSGLSGTAHVSGSRP